MDGRRHVSTVLHCHVPMNFFTSIEKVFKANQMRVWGFGNLNSLVDFSDKEKLKRTTNSFMAYQYIHSFSSLFSTLFFHQSMVGENEYIHTPMCLMLLILVEIVLIETLIPTMEAMIYINLISI